MAKNFASRGVPLSSAQVQFSLLSFGPEQQQLQEAAAELGVTVIAYSPLALGLLTGGCGGLLGCVCVCDWFGFGGGRRLLA